jgi:CPA1 family monovalent cation:H+ antiporter
MAALGPITEKGEASIEHFWEFAAFVANSVIFIILGINLARQDFANASWLIIFAIFAVLIGRAFAVYPVSAVYALTKFQVKLSHQHILFWGGLRGALALGLALSIPNDFPLKDSILIATFGVVAFSVFVQGSTVSPLMRYLGEIPRKSGSETPS